MKPPPSLVLVAAVTTVTMTTLTLTTPTMTTHTGVAPAQDVKLEVFMHHVPYEIHGMAIKVFAE